MVFCLGSNPTYNHKGKFKHIRVPETSDDSVPMSIRKSWIGVELETVVTGYVGTFTEVFELNMLVCKTSDTIEALRKNCKHEAADYWEANWQEEDMYFKPDSSIEIIDGSIPLCVGLLYRGNMDKGGKWEYYSIAGDDENVE